MARYTGPKARINRRLGAQIYEDTGTRKASERRQNPPGMHTRPRRPSNYGLALHQKQKVKHYYGLGERQLRRYFGNATRMKGNTGENLLLMCERRLDNVVRRAGFSKTRPQARQGVVHGHFQVNGVKTTKPSFIVRPGDVITVRRNEKILDVYRGILVESAVELVDWMTADTENLALTVLGLPGPSDISIPLDEHQRNVVVEFLSR